MSCEKCYVTFDRIQPVKASCGHCYCNDCYGFLVSCRFRCANLLCSNRAISGPGTTTLKPRYATTTEGDDQRAVDRHYLASYQSYANADAEARRTVPILAAALTHSFNRVNTAEELLSNADVLSQEYDQAVTELKACHAQLSEASSLGDRLQEEYFALREELDQARLNVHGRRN